MNTLNPLSARFRASLRVTFDPKSAGHRRETRGRARAASPSRETVVARLSRRESTAASPYHFHASCYESRDTFVSGNDARTRAADHVTGRSVRKARGDVRTCRVSGDNETIRDRVAPVVEWLEGWGRPCVHHARPSERAPLTPRRGWRKHPCQPCRSFAPRRTYSRGLPSRCSLPMLKLYGVRGARIFRRRRWISKRNKPK